MIIPCFATVCVADYEWRDALAIAAEAGYEYVELLMIPAWKHLMPYQVTPAELTAACQEAGVEIVAVHGSGLDGNGDDLLDASVTYVRSVIEYASEIGAKLINVNGMPTPHTTPAAERTAMLMRIVRGIERLMPALEQHGQRLTLENHYTYQIETLPDYLQIFDAIGQAQLVGATVDTGHFTASEVDTPRLIETLGPRVFHVHMKDHVGVTSVGLGYGNTDNAGVVAALRKIGYDGYVSVELEVHDKENERRYVDESLPYVQRLIVSSAQ